MVILQKLHKSLLYIIFSCNDELRKKMDLFSFFFLETSYLRVVVSIENVEMEIHLRQVNDRVDLDFKVRADQTIITAIVIVL